MTGAWARKRTGIKTVAVENFLGTLDGLTYQEAMMNLAQDAKSYGWNAETVAAIRAGILKRFFPTR